MSENQSENRVTPVPSPDKTSEEDIRRCIEAEIREMEKYKWCLGEKLQHDPLQDRSLNEIYCEWIDKYAADFRRCWDAKNKEKPPLMPN